MLGENVRSCITASLALFALGIGGADVRGQTSFTDVTATGAWNTNRWNNTSDAAPYTSAFTANNNVSFTAGSYAFAGMGATINVGNITVADGVTVNFPTISSTFATGGAVRTIDVGSGGLLDFQSQAFSTAAGTGFIKSGAGVLALAGSMYTGGFTLNDGTVILRGVNGMGAGGLLTINGGTIGTNANANRDLTGKYTSIVVGGDFTLGTTAGLSTGGGNITFSNAMSLGAANRTITLGGSGTMIFGGVISNTAGNSLTFAANGGGTGRFEVSNLANTFTGDLRITGGEVRFAADGSFGDASNNIIIDGGRLATLSGATYAISTTHAITIGDTAGTSISTPGAGVLTYNGVIADISGKTGAWAKQGGGTLALGGISTYTGATAINNGILQLTTGNNRLPTGTSLSLGQAASTNVGTLDLNGFNQQIAGLSSTAGTNTSSTVWNTITSTAAATLTVNQATNTTYSDGTAANSGRITGAVSLVKQGAGTLTLGDNTNNTYTGKTTVSGGFLAIGGEATLGADPGAFTADQITLNGGGIASTSGVTFSSNRGITLGASGGTFDTTGGTITLTNVVAGTAGGALTKIGTGNLVLDGAHTYNGATNVNAGTLTLATGGSLGSGDVTVGASGTLAVTATSLDLAGARLITNNGTVTGTVNINSGATAMGSGTYGSLAVNSGGTLSPGNSPGLMTMSDLTINGGNYLWELGALSTSNPGTDFDQVQVNSGNATLTGGSVTLDFNTLASGLRPDAGSPDPFWNSIHQWTILTVTGGGSLSGTFGSLVNGTFGVGTFSLGYVSGVNGSVQLNYAPGMAAVPEPSSLLLAGVAAIPLAWYRRRRKAALAAAPQVPGDLS